MARNTSAINGPHSRPDPSEQLLAQRIAAIRFSRSTRSTTSVGPAMTDTAAQRALGGYTTVTSGRRHDVEGNGCWGDSERNLAMRDQPAPVDLIGHPPADERNLERRASGAVRLVGTATP